jgi:hypothetical protein
MSNINFPSGPYNGQTYVFNDTTWVYNGVAWVSRGFGPQGLTGPQGITGPQGPQGDQGPQGGSGSSFAYEKVCFVHPNGNDSTAVIGRFNLPFQTIEGAFYGSNGLSMGSLTPLENGVIEVWPRNGRINQSLLGSLMPSVSHDYVINDTLIPTTSFKLHLKPGVHIRPTSKNSAFLDIQGSSPNVVTVSITTDEDYTSSIEQIPKNITELNYFANIGDYGRLILEGVNIYSDTTFKDGRRREKYYFSIMMGGRSELIMKNSHLYTTNATLQMNDELSYILSNIYTFPSPGIPPTDAIEIVEEVLGASISLENSKLSVVDAGGSITPTTNHIFYYTPQDNGLPKAVRLINSQFMNVGFDGEGSVLKSVSISRAFEDGFLATPTDLYVIADDNIFAYTADTGDLPAITSGGGVCFEIDTDITLHVSYASRNIHSYSSTYDGPGTLNELTGVAESISVLGQPGFGLNEPYGTIIRPYNV